MEICTKYQIASKTPGFGLIGILIVVALILFFAFGYQKLGSSQAQNQDETSVGTYQPIGTGDMGGQLDTGFEAKGKATDAVKNVQDRAARNIQGIE